jgi:hypothetical protein
MHMGCGILLGKHTSSLFVDLLGLYPGNIYHKISMALFEMLEGVCRLDSRAFERFSIFAKFLQRDNVKSSC